MRDERRWGSGRGVVFVVAGLLLLSMGGAVIAAPATVPLMHIAAWQHRTPGLSTLGGGPVGPHRGRGRMGADVPGA